MSVLLNWDDVPEPFDNSINNHLSQDSGFQNGTFQNTIFLSDNYPVLQKLTETPFKANLIYIDPPYNTKNDFTYNDTFSDDAWLSFMFHRLKLAQKLLLDSGCIFIAIDQSELYELKLLCDQVFGKENFINDFMWLHGKGKKDSWSRTLQQHTLCYAKDKKFLKPFKEIEYSSWAKKNADDDPRGPWFSGSISFNEKRSNSKHHNFYSVTSPGGKVWTRQWLVSKQEMDELIKDKRIFFGKAPEFDAVPREKIFNDTETQIIPPNIITEVESTRSAQSHLDTLLGEKACFDNPKPVDLISHLIEIAQMPEDAVILDFFAGSGTTFEAVCALNKKDGGRRRCVLVQKKENNIDQICLRRCEAVAKIFGVKKLEIVK